MFASASRQRPQDRAVAVFPALVVNVGLPAGCVGGGQGAEQVRTPWQILPPLVSGGPEADCLLLLNLPQFVKVYFPDFS